MKEDFQRMNNRIQYIEGVLNKYLPEKSGCQKLIFETMDYALMAGGKRLRPMFMHEVYKMCGGADERVIEPFMAAIEMIHTYSLVHDDLPAMDDDDYRRGRKTTHVVYGEAMGILAGDALLNYAYETAAKAFDIKDCNLRRVADALQILAKKAGVYGMVGGQAVDVCMNGSVPDMDTLMFIYINKTSALLEASFMIGGILAGAGEKDIQLLENISRNVGIAFQIQDDILDITSTTEELGKPVNSDARNEKVTFASYYGLDRAKEAVMDYSLEAEKMIDDMDISGDSSFVKKLIHELIFRTN